MRNSSIKSFSLKGVLFAGPSFFHTANNLSDTRFTHGDYTVLTACNAVLGISTGLKAAVQPIHSKKKLGCCVQ